MAKKEPPPLEDSYVTVIRYREVSRVLRCLILAIAVVLSIYIISNAIVKIIEKPTWFLITEVVISAIVGPSGLLYWFNRRMKKRIEKDHSRIKQLEATIQPTRTTSGLLKDGTEPPEEQV